jgi:hypothetical protein
MARSRSQAAAARVRALPAEVILRAASLCDGHGILDPQAFLDAGLPAEVVAHLTRIHRSDGSPKGTVFVQGRVMAQVEGVYGLHLLQFMAAALDVTYRACFGRGSQACAIREALQAHFGAMDRHEEG